MSPFGSWRRLLAVLAAVIALVGSGLMLPSVASASSGPSAAAAVRAGGASVPPALPGISDCKDAPTPEVPGRGVEAFFESAPATPPPAGDPFAQNATTTLHDQYQYAGLRWNTYDLGCTGSPEASVGTSVANWLFTLPKAVVSATGAMLGAAYQPSFLSVFDPLIQNVVDGLQRSVFQQWAGLVLAAVGFLIVWRARRASLSGTAAAIGWALLVMVLATVLIRWPLAAGQAADKTVVTTMSAVTSALDQHDAAGRTSTGTQAASNLHDALLYQIWLGGEFGDANSVTARRYGPQLFDAQALTWSEATTLNQDPAAGQRIIDAKKAKFKQVAAQVQAEDPDAYEYLVGRRTDARLGFAVLSVIAVACAVPFLLMAALLMIGALVITRFAVMLFPAIATLGLFPTMRNLVIGVGNTVAAAVINALVFGIGTAVMVKAFGVIMAPGNGLPSWLVVALLLLLTVVMWMTLRPFHRMTAMAAPGRNHFADAAGALGSVTRGIGRAGGRLVGTAAGVFVGESAADRKEGDGNRQDADRDRDKAAGKRAEGELRPDPAGASGSAGGSGGSGGGSASGSRPALIGGGRILGGRSRGSGGGGSGRPAEADPPGGGPRGGSGADADDGSLIAADVGLPAARQPVRRAAETVPARRPGAAASGPGGSRSAASGRIAPRRMEGADLDDRDGPDAAGGFGFGPGDGGLTSHDSDGEEVYAVYRPADRAGGRRV
jgi:hypothetical protein